jgi:hypothetical protein
LGLARRLAIAGLLAFWGQLSLFETSWVIGENRLSEIKTEVSTGFREKRRDNLLIDCAVSGV